jgi:glycosyltransferase involved in cell wall biosynthesis
VIEESAIRVLRIIARMNVGGPAIQITGLMQDLPSSEFKQLLVTGYCSAEELDYLDENQIDIDADKITGFGRSISVWVDLQVFLALRRKIKSFDPHIIHTHTAKAGILGRLASLTIRKKHFLVHTFHGHLLHGYFGSCKTRLVVLAERLMSSYTDVLIAVGSQVMEDLLEVKIGSREKFIVIGPGLELKELPPRRSVIKELVLPDEKYIISWIGRAVKIKAPERILEIARECKLRNLNVHFTISGDGPLLTDLKLKAIELELPIQFLGWQSDIERILSFSDLVILTSENEGMPVALIQAQMAGIPVLTTDVGSASEVLVNGKSGFCLDYSAKDFVDKIETLINNPQMQKAFSEAGKKNAIEKFSRSRLVSDHANLYRRLISQSNS